MEADTGSTGRNRQHLAVDIDCSVSESGGIRIKSGEQRFYEGMIGFKFPMILSGIADVHEWYDNALNKFRISVAVSNRVFSRLFGYNGFFDAEYINVKEGQIPADVKPLREEQRE